MARDAGERRVILFNLSGHGHFDMGAYDAYLAGDLAALNEEQVAARLVEQVAFAEEGLTWHFRLHAAGVETVLDPLERGPVFENIERRSGRIQQCLAPGTPLTPPPLPESWSRATAWSIVPATPRSRPTGAICLRTTYAA